MGTKQSMKRIEGKHRKHRKLVENGSIPSPEHRDKYCGKSKTNVIYSGPNILDELKTEHKRKKPDPDFAISYERITVTEKLVVKSSPAEDFSSYKRSIYDSLFKLDKSVNSTSEEDSLSLISRIQDLLENHPLTKRIEDVEKEGMYNLFRQLKISFMASKVLPNEQYPMTVFSPIQQEDLNEKEKEMMRCFKEFEKYWAYK